MHGNVAVKWKVALIIFDPTPEHDFGQLPKQSEAQLEREPSEQILFSKRLRSVSLPGEEYEKRSLIVEF
jgi:hypothetical protein